MSKGKFSNPRPYRDEEREIEQAFRQVTGQAPPPEPHTPPAPEDYIPQDFPELILDGEPMEEKGHFEAEEPPEEPDFVDKMLEVFHKASAFCGENRKLVMVCLCALALVLIVSFSAVIYFSTSDPYDGRILPNVYVAGVNVGGMTKGEAVDAVHRATDQTYSQQDMVVDLAGTILKLQPADTKVRLDVKAAVNAAFSYGRTGSKEERALIAQTAPSANHFIGLLPYLNLDKAYIQGVLNSYAQDIGSTLTQTAYGLEGKMPALDTEDFDETAKTQTLVILMGTPGVGFDAQEVFQQILDAYSLHLFQVCVENIDPVAEPDPLDLESVYEEFYIAPVNASIDMQTFETIPGSYGYGFDLEAAEALLKNAAYGQEIRIPMEYIAPEIVDEDVFFRDVLGSYETRHNSNKDRNTNLALACKALDGLVLNPGEEFSYNNALGKRTAEKGYKPAPSYAGLETVDTLGGGICQVSSTLYYCVLLGDLRVTERQNHSFLPGYTDYGMDATVSWGGPDFRFINSTNYPIKIEAEVSGGYVRVRILGTDEKDYYVKMDSQITNVIDPKTEYQVFPFHNEEGYTDGEVIQEGVTGYYVKSYKLKYDKSTNALLSKDFEANSSYATVDRVVAKVEPEATEPPTTEAPPTQAPTEPTEPETTAPPTEPETTEPTVPETTTPPTEETQPTLPVETEEAA